MKKIAFEDSADSRELHSACSLPYSLKYSDTFGNLRAILYSGYSIGADESCSPLFRENLTVVTYESVGTLARLVYSYACKVTPTCMNSQSSDDNMAGVPVQGEDVGEA